ncbi:MAG: hypothetical protein AB7O98_03435 [Hyphomonadaceae bacterium]
MSRREIERQIRSKQLQIDRLKAEIREAEGYIAGLQRRLVEEPAPRLAARPTQPVRLVVQAGQRSPSI